MRRGVDRIAGVAARIGVRAILGPPPRILAGWIGSEGVDGVGGVDGGVVEGVDVGVVEGIGGGEAVRGFLVGLAVEVYMVLVV